MNNKLYVDYNQFNLEQLLMEAIKEMKFVLSQRFRDVLSEINSEISDELLKSHTDLDFKTRQTFIDIVEGVDDSVSFILANKAADLLNITEEDLEKKLLNRKLRDGIYSDSPVYSQQRGTMKLGRFINTVFPGKFPASLRSEAGQKNKDVEGFVRIYKSKFDQEAKFELFDVVRGSDIAHWYWYEHYQNRNGSLGGSCMSDVDSSYFQIYTRNKDVVGLVILYSDESKSKIKGRAVLWNLIKPENKTYMDRIYTNDSKDEELFMEYAKSKKWLYKGYQSYGPDSNIVDGGTGESTNMNMKAQLDNRDYHEFPYMDTMIYFNPESSVISNQENGMMYILQSTGGDYDTIDDDNYDYEETVHSVHEGDDIPRREARWCEIGQDWVYSNNAIRVYNTGLGSEVYAVPGDPSIVHCFIRDISDKYFPKDKCVWSDYLNTWVFKSSAKEVYTEKDKSSFVLDHKKREGNTFAKVGNDYYDISLVNKINDNTYELK